MIYFEDARLEFFGMPIAYLPYFSAPDPTVKRKTGFLMPYVSPRARTTGSRVEMPYYWALAPDYDVTFAPMITTKQGPLLQGEFRQRLINGAYSIRAAGIYQLDKDYFASATARRRPGYRDFRGSVETIRPVRAHRQMGLGLGRASCSPTRPSSRTTTRPVALPRQPIRCRTAPPKASRSSISPASGNRSYFDARSIYYLRLLEADVQSQIPVIHPVIDYTYTFDHPVLGGELSYKINFTSLTRQQANFDPITQTRSTTAPARRPPIPPSRTGELPAARHPRHLQPLLGRGTMAAQHHRLLRPGLHAVRFGARRRRRDADQQRARRVATSSQTGETDLVRAMPTVGLEYRYPFISVQSWGTQTIEPIAQVIVRPNEPQIGRLPNEDAQSLIFDDSNLFSVDKFSGWDRVEGGGRANVRRAVHRAVQPGRLRQRAVRPVLQPVRHEFVRAGRRHQHRPRQRPRHHAVRLRRARCPTSRTRPTPSRRASASTTTPSRCKRLGAREPRQFRPLELSACSTAITPRSPSSASSTRRQGVLGSGSRQARRQLGAARRGPLRHRRRQIRPDPVRPRLYRRLPHLGPELHHQLHLQAAIRRADHRSCCS